MLAALKARGLVTGILSNGDPAMLEVAVKSAGLTEVLDHVLSVEPVRCFKPDPRVYGLGLETLRRTMPDLSVREVWFVSSNGWDAVGATWFGYTTYWLNRAGLPPEELGTQPSFEGRNLQELLMLIDRAAGGSR